MTGPKIQEQALSRRSNPTKRGEITDAAFSARAGDPAGLKLLAQRAGPGLRSIAQRLLTESEVRLSAEQLARMALAQFVENDAINFQSREDLFAFAEEASARLIDRIATEGSTLPADSAAFKSLRAVFRSEETQQHPIVLSQALKVVAALNADYGRLLNLRYVLLLDATKSAQWLEIEESEIRIPWEHAQNLLLRASIFVAELGLATADSDSLDASQLAAYSETDSFSSLSLQALSRDSEPAADLATLRAKNADLTARLRDAEERIAELEAQFALDGEPDTRETRQKVADLLELGFGTVSLEDVPIYTGTSNIDEIWQHLETHYGQWLKHFGADHDSISRMEVEQHDPDFVKKAQESLSRERGKEKRESGKPHTPTLGQILPRKSDLGDLTLAGKTVEDLFDPTHRDLAALVCGRLRRLLYDQ